MCRILFLTLLGAGNLLAAAGAQTPESMPAWAIGPFVRPPDAQPIIRPDPAAVFDCPVQGKPVHWAAKQTFNPAAVVRDGKVCVLYRAEDDTGKGIGTFTSRLGLAVSEDGIHFQPRPAPVLYPDKDDQQAREWIGGCEDPRAVELEDGSFALFYTQYQRADGKRHVGLGLAVSKDLTHWTKLGPVAAHGADGREMIPRKSASLVTELRGGRLVAVKINGLYWLYHGEGDIRVLASPDLRMWESKGPALLAPRAGRFDSGLAECGPPAVLTAQGIVLIYNGKNAAGDRGDPNLGTGAYAGGQALFDGHDPTKLLARTDTPFFRPELPWEKSGQYVSGTTFLEGLAPLKDQWFLYYGCADTFVGVAVAPRSSPQALASSGQQSPRSAPSTDIAKGGGFALAFDSTADSEAATGKQASPSSKRPHLQAFRTLVQTSPIKTSPCPEPLR